MRCLMSYEKGFATVAISIALLIGTSILALHSTQSSIAEQRVSANDYRVKQAFEAADGGLEKGYAFLNENGSTIVVDSDNDGFIDAYTNNEITNSNLSNSASFTVTYSNVTANDFSLIQVTSVGTSADGTVTRTVSERFTSDPILSNLPTHPFTAKESVSMGGNLSITNSHTDTSILAGGAVTLSGSADTQTVNYSSDRRGLESDVNQNDGTLSAMNDNDFFQSYFGGSKSSIESQASIKLSGTGNDNYSSDLDGVKGKVIWIDQPSGEARINSNTTIGTPSEPVILIVNGDFHLNGSATIHGIVYVAKDWNNSGGGTLDINGSAIVEGNFTGQGTPNVDFNPTILGTLQGYGGSYASVPGSWRDF